MTMTQGELDVLHSCMDSSTHYLEFGSGASTVYASKSLAIKTIDSVESSKKYIDENLKPNPDIAAAIAANKLHFHTIDIGETTDWGYPRNKAKKHLWPNYSLHIFSEKKNYDLALVDSRFRVACTLNCVLNTPDYCTIIIHDFWDRPQYHVVLKYLEVKYRVDKLGVFNKKPAFDIERAQSLIRLFQYLPDDKTLAFRIRNKITNHFTGYRS